MTELIVREFLGNRIRQREDGFLSLTDMCQANGKLFGNWSKTKDAQQYLEALQEKHYSDRNSGPIEVNEGGDHSTGLTGTWGDRRVALRLAQWISAGFALQVDEWIEELMLKGTVSIAPPKTPLELAKEQVKLHEALELQAMQIKLLEEDNLRQSEAIDELFDYSSIIRIAKYNNVNEKSFTWHKLKASSIALNLEIKKVPCPRFGTKNLYSHTAWRLAYPGISLPETTTLTIG